MKHYQNIIIRHTILIIFLLLLNEGGFSQIKVKVGDTLMIGPVEVTPPGGCSPGEITYTHHIGADFYINIPYDIYQHGPTSRIGNLMFAPQKIGFQCDTFFVTEKGAWNRTYPCGPDTHDTFMICAEGYFTSKFSSIYSCFKFNKCHFYQPRNYFKIKF